MSQRSGSLVLRTLLVFLVTGGWEAYAQTKAPDVILVNGRVFTAADARPYAQAIAIKGSRILAVGTSQEISSMARRGTRRIDLGGRLVMPGINDAHVHFDEDPIGVSVDFDSGSVCARVLDRLEQALKKAPRGTLLTGTIDPTAFFDPACTPAALDRIAPEHAVVLWTPTLHAAMLNQAATRKFSVRTGDPPVLGGWFGKDICKPRAGTEWCMNTHGFASSKCCRVTAPLREQDCDGSWIARLSGASPPSH